MPQTLIQTVDQHLRAFFDGHAITEHQWTLGPVPDEMPEFRVLCAAPGPRSGCWTYLSRGAGSIDHEEVGRFEFFLLAPHEDLRHVELITMIAWYHKTKVLGLGHTFPIGESWLRGSKCDHMLVSKPYTFGPELEICPLGDDHLHIVWLLPITEAERDFKAEQGLEPLEQAFEDAGLEYWNPARASIIS